MEGLKLASPLLFKGSSAVSGLSTCILVMALVTGCGSGSTSMPASPVSNANWVLAGNTGMTGNVYIISDPRGYLYAASNDGTGGFATSTNGGVTWSPFNSGSPTPCHWGMGLNDLGEVMAGYLPNNNVIACNTSQKHYLLRLVGNGNTWTATNYPATDPVMAFVIAFGVAGNGNVIAAGSGGLYYSTDHGSTWNQPTTAPPVATCGEKLSLSTSSNGTISVSTADCTDYYSTDGGVNWTAFPQGIPFQGFQDNTNFLAPNGMLLDSWDGGHGTYCYGPQPPPNGNWSTCDTGLDIRHGVEAGGVVVNLSKTKLFVANGGFGCGIYMSTNNGQNWSTFNSGLPSDPSTKCGGADVRAITMDNSGFLYAILNSGPVYKTVAPQ